MAEEVEIPQEPEKSKAELFHENPDRFEDLKSCVLVVKRDEDGRLQILNQCEDIDETFIIEGRVREAMGSYRTVVRLEAQKRMKAGAIVAPGKNPNFLNSLRKNFKR